MTALPWRVQGFLDQAAKAFRLLMELASSCWAVLAFVSIGMIFSAIIPPLQSPDELDHLRAAYMLGRGKILMESRDGSSSGTMIDAGLEAFMLPYSTLPVHGDRKLSRSMIDATREIRWSGNKCFVPAPTSANYFPLVYLPQCIGLRAGRAFGFTVFTSYYLARFCSLLTAALLLSAAFRAWSPSPLTLFLLALPMSVFQFSSASLDGVTVAMAVLFLSLFLRICLRKGDVRFTEFLVLTGLAALLGTSRLHTIPLFAAVFFACWLSGKRRCWWAAACSGLLVLLWVAFILHHNVDTRRLHEGSCSGNLGFYLSHPLEFPRILMATLAKPGQVVFFGESFVGILGWLDTRLPEMFYGAAGACLLVVTAGSVWSRSVGNLWKPRLLLLGCSLASLLVLLFAILVQWNQRPAEVIEGIQGRYFLIPALMFSYGVSADRRLGAGVARKAALLLFAGFVCVSFFIAAQALLARYYIQP